MLDGSRFVAQEPDQDDVGEAATPEARRFGPTPVSDAQLLHLVRSGDTAAMSVLFHRYQGLGVSVAQRAGLSLHDAEEAASDAWVSLLRHVARGGGPATHFRAYLTQAVRNAAITRWRQLQNAQRVALEHGEFEARTRDHTDEHQATLDRMAPDPRAEWATRALRDLSPEMRALVVRAWLDDASLSTIAAELDITPAVAASRAYRARKALQRRYRHHERLSEEAQGQRHDRVAGSSHQVTACLARCRAAARTPDLS